jgi:hypothetical protein
MKLQLLPKEVQDLIGEFNVEHRPNMRLVLDEFLVKQKDFENRYICPYCGKHLDEIDEKYSTYIYSQKYNYCSGWCMNNQLWAKLFLENGNATPLRII